MLTRLDVRDARADLATRLTVPRAAGTAQVDDAVTGILDAVAERGDDAVRELTERFDGVRLDALAVPAPERSEALDALDPDLRAALELAAARIRAHHETQAAPPGAAHTSDGVTVEELVRPVERAGLYVPGGRAAYPSTVLMTAVTAQVAGVPERVLCVPPGPDGTVPAVTLAAAALCGVEEVYRIGGAQAIAAMAYGTESIRPVDVVVGPGNAYVDAAKRAVAGRGLVGIDGPAGPSELVVIADAAADPVQAALDLAAQAEHGPGGRAVLVAWDPDVLDAVVAAVEAYVAEGARVEEISATLAAGGQAVLVRDAVQAVEVANLVAPEHLELLVSDPDPLLGAVHHAGAVFVDVPTAIGDYVAGPNHVLPTGGAARFASALRVDDFRTHVHVVRAAGDLARVGRAAVTLATAEGLTAHARSVEHRMER